MKRYLSIVALIALTALTATAQTSDKLRRDVTYSTHNYKHPNKAAVARQWENQKGVSVRTPEPGRNTAANYKHSVPGAEPVGGVVVSHTPQLNAEGRNYKMPRSASSANAKRSEEKPREELADRAPAAPDVNP